MLALEKAELSGIDEIACDVRSGSHVGEMYLTKLGITETSSKLEYEMTGSANKSSSVWEILESAALGDIKAEYPQRLCLGRIRRLFRTMRAHGLSPLNKILLVSCFAV